MSATQLSVSQAACILAGLRPITSLSDSSDAAIALSNVYYEIVDDCLGNYPWRFAMKEWELSRLVDTPLNGRWSACYQIPSDVLRVTGVFVGGIAIQYDRFDDNIYCDANDSDVVVMEGTYRAVEADWPPGFKRYATYSIGSMLAESVTLQPEQAKWLDEKAQRLFFRAKHSDAQAQTNRRILHSRLVDVRSG